MNFVGTTYLIKLNQSLLQWLDWQKSKSLKAKLVLWIITSYEIPDSSFFLGCI